MELLELAGLFPEYEFHFSGFMEIELGNRLEVEKRLEYKKIDVVINCLENPKYHFPELDISLVTGLIARATKVLADTCHKRNILLIQVSTDEVFDGQQEGSYDEERTKRPLSLYGNLKDGLEKIILKAAPKNSIIIRSSWLYSIYGDNILKSIVRNLKKGGEVYLEEDKISSPTNAWELAFFILEHCIETKFKSGETYHLRSEGWCSKYEFGKEVQKYIPSSCKILPVKSADGWHEEEMDYLRVLNNHKVVSKFNYRTSHWKTGIANCMHLMDRNYGRDYSGNV